MCNDIRVTKQEVRDFLLINFGLITFLAIFVFISFSKPNSDDFLYNFAITFMYIPAFSVMIVLKKSSYYEFGDVVNKFFNFFMISTVVRVIFSILEPFFIKNIIISSLIDPIVSLYILYSVFVNSSEFEIFNLSLNKNFKKVLFCIGIYLVIFTVGCSPDLIHMHFSVANFIDALLQISVGIVMNIILGISLFFGEEFGWRYFLQPRLQKIYGKRLGVIILGPIWGIWHLPLCMTLYSPQTPVYCIISHVLFCTTLGVFLGYAYMKTENLWTPMLIHLIGNLIALSSGGGLDTIITLNDLLIAILFESVLYLPFLFAKVYRPKKDDIGVSIDN